MRRVFSQLSLNAVQYASVSRNHWSVVNDNESWLSSFSSSSWGSSWFLCQEICCNATAKTNKAFQSPMPDTSVALPIMIAQRWFLELSSSLCSGMTSEVIPSTMQYNQVGASSHPPKFPGQIIIEHKAAAVDRLCHYFGSTTTTHHQSIAIPSSATSWIFMTTFFLFRATTHPLL